MRMETPVTGIASVDGSPGPPKRFSKLGFSAVDKPYTSQGFWLNTDRGTKIENTEMQTFLTRLNFNSRNAEGYAARDNGLNLVDHQGLIFVRPRFRMQGAFNADRFSHFSLKKSGPEKLIIDRIAVARTAAAALNPQIPAVAPKPAPANSGDVGESTNDTANESSSDESASPSQTAIETPS